ncbi:hypothetical protein TL16_g07695 [Triparma laevis f. inornata]|uniref:Carboxypeptidase n=1 Tax=Triparma laevis f. inornata TaxID=1714386 RepID=A0A9W7EIK3_9STRA|nr:hypothetical protein TL16_g07695 [Triparma laevis f. inornata]
MGMFMLPTQPTHNVSTTLSSSLQSRTHLVDNKLLDLPVEIKDLPMYAGFVPTNLEHPELDSHLFYWLLESQKQQPLSAVKETPLVIWLNGGPGASSLTGILLELGPFMLERSGELKYNEFGWTQEAHVLAIDNPVGAGFSFTSSEEVDGVGYVNDLGEMAEQLYTGIVGILDLHPWLKDSSIFIAGESYAGKYIPAISHYILEKTKEGDNRVNLQGIAIGNGELKPYTAYASTPDYLKNLGLIDTTQQAWAHEVLKECKSQVDAEDWIKAFKTCQGIEDKLFADFVQIPFIYDIREKTDFFTDLTAVATTWLNEPNVHKALNVGSRPWRQSDGQGPSSIGRPVPEHLKLDEMQPIPDSVITDLIDNYRFMLYSGQYDGSSCNFLGTERMLEDLDWDGKEAYETSERKVWKVDGSVAGYAKGSTDNFSFVLVANSGHLVPTNQPENALDMLRRFLNNEEF